MEKDLKRLWAMFWGFRGKEGFFGLSQISPVFAPPFTAQNRSLVWYFWDFIELPFVFGPIGVMLCKQWKRLMHICTWKTFTEKEKEIPQKSLSNGFNLITKCKPGERAAN
jgi:hypothetical protein